MTDITKKNDVYLQVDTDRSTARALADFFTFEVPGAKFMPAYRNRIWDGKIRLYSYATGQMYVGLYPYLKDWCNKKNVKIEEINEILVFNTVSAADIQALIDTYDISITPRDYQIDAFKYALENDRGLILSPTASGKSLISYMLVRHYLNTIDNNIPGGKDLNKDLKKKVIDVQTLKEEVLIVEGFVKQLNALSQISTSASNAEQALITDSKSDDALFLGNANYQTVLGAFGDKGVSDQWGKINFVEDPTNPNNNSFKRIYMNLVADTYLELNDS